MIQSVTDASSNRSDKIANAAKIIGKSKDRLKVFLAIYSGKKKVKTVSDILDVAGLTNKIRVLQEGKKLASGGEIVEQTKVGNETAYQKIDFYTQHRNKIISLVKNKNKLESFPTKTNPQFRGQTKVIVKFNRNFVKIKQVYVDDVDSFAKVKQVNNSIINPIYEHKMKIILKKIFGEKGKFTDWGGETDDLFSTRLKINGRRISAAFALKGKGTKGILVPKKMGNNGDQIQRLFKSPAQIFFIQYGGQISESILDQMKTHAIARSVTENTLIYYGIIDGQDTSRLAAAYSKS